MKKILFTIIGLSALFCMSSCDEAVYKGRKVYKAYFDYTLKDPLIIRLCTCYIRNY